MYYILILCDCVPLTILVPEGSSFSTIKRLKKNYFKKLSLVKYLCESEREKKKKNTLHHATLIDQYQF